MNITKIFKNNEKWIEKELRKDKNYFKNLSKVQNPDILYIGCSDSRVPPEILMGVQPGEVFVHRNIANLVPNNDLNVMSVISYAVNQLKVNNIIVCGHYNCGGVLAAMQSNESDTLSPPSWLTNIHNVCHTHKDELDIITNETEKYNRLVELNVQEQCKNVIKIPDVQNACKERKIKIHGWIFDIHSGKLIDLKIDTNEIS